MSRAARAPRFLGPPMAREVACARSNQRPVAPCWARIAGARWSLVHRAWLSAGAVGQGAQTLASLGSECGPNGPHRFEIARARHDAEEVAAFRLTGHDRCEC